MLLQTEVGNAVSEPHKFIGRAFIQRAYIPNTYLPSHLSYFLYTYIYIHTHTSFNHFVRFSISAMAPCIQIKLLTPFFLSISSFILIAHDVWMRQNPHEPNLKQKATLLLTKQLLQNGK